MFTYVLSAALIVHGFIHFSGYKGRGPTYKSGGRRFSKAVVRLLWLLAGTAFMAAGVLAALHSYWWVGGLVAILLSMLLVVTRWKDARYGTIVNALLLIPLAANFADWRFERNAMEEVRTMMSLLRKGNRIISKHDIAQLPAPVQKWLTNSGTVGHMGISLMRLKQRGQLRMEPNGRWMDMTAEQYFNADHQAFIWLARIKYGVTHIAGKDVYKEGHGHVQISIASMYDIADASGAETDQGSMLRYLAEIQWFPSAALSPLIAWKELDSVSAMATITYNDKYASGIFRFDAAGRVKSFEALRYMNKDGHYSLEQWWVPVTGYTVFDGITVPSKGRAVWKLAEGDFDWFHWEITDLDYDNAAPYQR